MRRRAQLQAQPQTALESLLRFSKFIRPNQLDSSAKTSARSISESAIDSSTTTDISHSGTATHADVDNTVNTVATENADNSNCNNSNSSARNKKQNQQQLTNKQAQRKLLQRSEVPVYLQDNPYVLSHYRDIQPSITNSLHSLTYLHNETCNIYTHLIPCICILIFTIYFLTCSTDIPLGLFFPMAGIEEQEKGSNSNSNAMGSSTGSSDASSSMLLMNINSTSFPIKTFVVTYQQHRNFYKNISGMDRMVLLIWLATTGMCFGLSAVFHTLLNHSKEVAGLCLRMDYVGIVAGIVGNFVSGVYVGFWCEEEVWRAYWGMILSLAVITILIILNPKLQGTEYRTWRTYAFIATGFSGLLPLGHGVARYGWHRMWLDFGMPYYILEGILFLMGAVVFITRIPEVFSPGRYDIWASSHQIFHSIVVLAMLTHGVGILRVMEHNLTSRSCSV